MQDILQHLKQNGEQLDADIAKAMGMPLSQVRTKLTGLLASGDVMICQVTRFNGTKKIEGWSCRVAGYIPPAAPGRKPKSAVRS